MQQTSKFRHTKPAVDPAVADAFISGAETHSVAPLPGAAPAALAPATAAGEGSSSQANTEGPVAKQFPPQSFLLRLSPDLRDLLDFVFNNSLTKECKSKQKLIETILQKGLEEKKAEILRRPMMR